MERNEVTCWLPCQENAQVTIRGMDGQAVYGPAMLPMHFPSCELAAMLTKWPLPQEWPLLLAGTSKVSFSSRLGDVLQTCNASRLKPLQEMQRVPDGCCTAGCIRVSGHLGCCQDSNLTELQSDLDVELTVVWQTPDEAHVQLLCSAFSIHQRDAALAIAKHCGSLPDAIRELYEVSGITAEKKDVDLAMVQVSCSRSQALAALIQEQNDIVEAIMFLTSRGQLSKLSKMKASSYRSFEDLSKCLEIMSLPDAQASIERAPLA